MPQDQQIPPPDPPCRYANLFVEFQEAQRNQRLAHERFLKASPDKHINNAYMKEFKNARDALHQADIEVLRLYNNVLSELQRVEEKVDNLLNIAKSAGWKVANS